MRVKRTHFLTGLMLALAMEMPAANDVPGVPVSVLITAESKAGESAVLTKDDVRVQQGKDSRPISEVKQLNGAKTEMLLLIDDSAGDDFDSQIQDLKKFVITLPVGVDIGVGYMRNGMTQMTSQFSDDHAKAANSIRVAAGLGGADVSPYDSLSDAIKKWPKKDDVLRREVIMISSGIEGLGGGSPPENPYVNAGIETAQKAGVVVYAIYNPGYDHAGHSFWRASSGQNFLSQLTDETGGELYMVGFGSVVSFEPYLSDILKRQSQQYELTFEARAEKKSGLQPVRISTTTKGTSIAAPDKVYVKASL